MDEDTRKMFGYCVILVIVLTGLGTAATFLSPVTPPIDDTDTTTTTPTNTTTPTTIPSGAVSCYGGFAITGNNTPVSTGTFSAYYKSGSGLAATDAIGASGWDANLNPGDYIGVFEATNYYPYVWEFNVPDNISGTRTHNVGTVTVYPISADYTITFQNTTAILATKTDSAQSDSALSTDNNANAYTLTLQNEDDYSALGIPAMDTLHPNREVIETWVLISFNTSNVVCPEADFALPLTTGNVFAFKMTAAIAGSSVAVVSRSLTLKFTVDGVYDMDISMYTFTNRAQIEEYKTGYAPTGWTLTTYALATDIAVTAA